jgi:transglutaminase-like putative cysteine protease
MIQTRVVTVTAIVFSLLACASSPRPARTAVRIPALTPAHLKNPRVIEAELTVTLENIRPLTGDQLAADNATLDLDPDKTPELHVWSSQIVPRRAQSQIEFTEISPPPLGSVSDPVNGNEILHWDLTPNLVPGGAVTLRRRFTYVCHEIDFDIDPDQILPYDTNSALYRFYTKSERLIETDDPRIRAIAAEITAEAGNPYERARRIFQWVCDSLDYHYPPGERGACATLERGSGDCGEYSFLFIALCRASGIPARLVAGFKGLENTGHHAWAEFYLPGVGWVPADASMADREDGDHDFDTHFAHLPNDRLVASVGTNIPVRPTVQWANWSNSEIDQSVTDFMQLWTQAGSGFDASYAGSVSLRSAGTPAN